MFQSNIPALTVNSLFVMDALVRTEHGAAGVREVLYAVVPPRLPRPLLPRWLPRDDRLGICEGIRTPETRSLMPHGPFGDFSRQARRLCSALSHPL